MLVAAIIAIYCCLQAKNISENSLVILENDLAYRAKVKCQGRVKVVYGLLLTCVSLMIYVVYGFIEEMIGVVQKLF